MEIEIEIKTHTWQHPVCAQTTLTLTLTWENQLTENEMDPKWHGAQAPSHLNSLE